MRISPLILGSGLSGQTLEKSFAILTGLRPELDIGPAVRLERGVSLREERNKYEYPILCIANPHGLHAQAILEADLEKYTGIICEKPACVNMQELEQLRSVKTPTAVLHVYRQMWGIKTLKNMIEENLFGEIISIEGRYWQASTADRAIQAATSASTKGWKDDTALSGHYDTYLDIASHWIDAASYLAGSVPKIRGWRSFINANSPHRDSHVQLVLDFPKTRGFGSISKTVHGATNQFEIHVIGSRLSGTWKFLEPDELLIGEGRNRTIVTRKENELGSKQPAHHGMGWIEGYIETASQFINEIYGHGKGQYPSLENNLNTLEAMLKIQWDQELP